MGKYLDKMEALYIKGFDEGQLVGQQQTFDSAIIYLARQGWTGKQLVEFFNGCVAVTDEFADAWRPNMEQDVAQERMDRNLEAAYEGEVELVPFSARYPAVKNLGYTKPVREERHPATKKHGRKKK